MKTILTIVLSVCLAHLLVAADWPEKNLATYRAELTACRADHGGSYDVPDVKFFLFGMGARTKLLYRDGILFDARSGRELQRWKVRKEIIVPPDYTVSLETEDGKLVTLREDSAAVWLEQGGQRTALEGTKSAVKLPDFAGKKFPLVLRVLHQELLVNIVEAGPVPNFFVYEKPWYRDGAMVALALKETGNLDLLKPWILGLREPFDKNNKGETEADNLGQALFLISLVADKNHPLVAKVLAEVPRFEKTNAAGRKQRDRSLVEKACTLTAGSGIPTGMRQPRLKAPASHPVAYYHCLSRVVDRQFVLGETEKEQFVSLMREYEAFCGIRVLTFCIMSNHFHLLVEVPQRPEQLPSDEELLQRVEKLSGLAGGGTTRQMLERFRQQGHDKRAEEYREQLFARMWDVSAFMKLLKQRFTQGFNRERKRKGTLWEERFKSVLVEGAGDALATMAAYIDLNPVRAKLVEDPQEYRWCGYAEAMAGKRRAKEGLRIVAAGGERVAPEAVPLSQALAKYRVWLYGQGECNDGLDAAGQPLRAGLSAEAVAQVIAEKGRVRLADYLRIRVRYFADGAVLGTKGFVNEVFTSFRERFGEKRKDGARRLRGVENESLHTLRDLRLRPVG